VSPILLSLNEVVEIHRDVIERYGGSSGIRDMGLLQSAVAVPQASFGGEYLHTGLFEMAAAFLFHLVQNHPFLDGNKRTGAMAAFTFLWVRPGPLWEIWSHSNPVSWGRCHSCHVGLIPITGPCAREVLRRGGWREVRRKGGGAGSLGRELYAAP
jgi:death-on-curing family protein